MDDSATLKSIDKKLAALIAITAFSIFGDSDEKSRTKPEILLSNAGLENTEIAKILGKSLPAVQKSLQRAKK
jgi:hypothetical protein